MNATVDIDLNNLNFIVEVAENGFIMTTTIPEGEKSLRKEVKSIYATEEQLFEAIRFYLAKKDDSS